MKRYTLESLDDLRDEVVKLYEIAYDICDENMVEGILLDNGAREDDAGEYGFLTGVSKSQLQSMIQELTNLINRVQGEEVYSIKLSESEIDVLVEALDQLTPINSKMYAQIRAIRNKLR